MKKDNYESNQFQNDDTTEDPIMNKVNQTFEKIEQEVKELINMNEEESKS